MTPVWSTLSWRTRRLGIETLAEGIEDRDQLQALQREDCDHGQGFLFSRPLEVDAVERFLTGGPSSVAHVTVGQT